MGFGKNVPPRGYVILEKIKKEKRIQQKSDRVVYVTKRGQKTEKCPVGYDGTIVESKKSNLN